MSGPQLTLSQYFTRDHRNCDAQWAEVEAASEGAAAGKLASAWGRFETRSGPWRSITEAAPPMWSGWPWVSTISWIVMPPSRARACSSTGR